MNRERRTARAHRTLTYREIADDLERRIRVGEHERGQALPQYRDHAQEYSVSVSTAQRATMLLCDRGLVLGVPGRGVFVMGRPRLS